MQTIHAFQLSVVNDCPGTGSKVFPKFSAYSKCRWLLCLVLLFSTLFSYSQTNTWTGASNNNWNNSGNWTLGHVPNVGEDVVVPGPAVGITKTIRVNTNAQCKTLTINAGLGRVNMTINSGRSLTVVGALTLFGSATPILKNSLGVGAETLNAGSIIMQSGGGSEITSSNGDITVDGDILMNGSNLENDISFSAAGNLYLGGDMDAGGNFIPGTSTVTLNGSSDQHIGGNTTNFYNLTINKSASSNTVHNSSKALSVSNIFQLTQGVFVASASDANFTVGGDFNISNTGTFTHDVDWDNYGKLISLSGNVNIDGIFQYLSRSHVQLNASGSANVRTGSNPSSAFGILTAKTGNYFASGPVRIDDNFWGMFGTTGSFHTNGNDVYANSTFLNAGGTVYVDGGSLNVTGSALIGYTANGGMNISSGTFNVDYFTIGNGTNSGTISHSGGTVNVSGDLTINNSGAYNCTGSPSINISGYWINNKNAAAFSPANSTVTFNNNSALQSIYGSSTSHTFNNITINKPGQTLNISGSASSLQLNGNLLISAGTLDAGTAANIGVGGNWTNNGTSFVAGTGTVIFNGSTAQSLNGTTQTNFNKVQINNASGVNLSSQNMVINGNVAGALDFQNGLINTGAKMVMLGGTNGTVTGAAAGKYVNGFLRLGIATGSPTRVFEIGDAGNYTPVSVVFNNVTVSGYSTVNTTAGDHPNIITSGIDETKNVNRIWNITNNGTTVTNLTPTFNFTSSDIDAGANPAIFIVGRYTSFWSYPTTGTRNPLNTTATVSGFGAHVVGEASTGAPILTIQPSDWTACEAATTTLTAAANAKPNCTAIWQYSTDGGFSFNTLPMGGAYSSSSSTVGNVTTTILTINPVAMAMNGYSYRALFTNNRGATPSFDAILSVNESPSANAGAAMPPICGSGASAPLGGSIGGSATTGTWTSNVGGSFNPNANTLNATWTPPGGFIGTATLTLTATGGGCAPATNSKTIEVGEAVTPVTITPASASICINAIQALTVSSSTNSTKASGSIGLSIPDNNTTGISNILNIARIPVGATINSVSVTLNVSHPRVNDLIMNLTAPNGKTINLYNRTGSNGANFTNTVVSSSSSTAFSSGSPSFTGTFKADAANGVGATGFSSNTTVFTDLFSTANGNWTLSARDARGSNTGSISNWTITINYTDPVTWLPVTNLYTNAGATIPYVAGSNAKTVYYKSATAQTNTYTATTTGNAGCTQSNTVTVTAGPVVTIAADYCYGGGKIKLTASSTPAATSWLWNTGETTSFILVDIAGLYSVTATTAAGCVASTQASIAQELVVNGDFNAGNTGFTSAYTFRPSTIPNNMYPENTYTVYWNPNYTHGNFWGRDHTTNTGNMLIVNGSGTTPPPEVWQTTVNVEPNTDYYFSAWAISLNNVGPFANLQFKVNGVQVGSTTGALPSRPTNNNPPYNWTRFYGSWNSGSNTTATVSIVDLETAAGGNDFALDDISFGTLSTFVTLTSATGTDNQTVCKNSSLTNIVYNVGSGAAGPIVAGLPAGVSSNFNGVTLTISGSPTVTGDFHYSITTTGTCNPVTVYGDIHVQEETITLSSAAGTNNQTVCLDQSISNITYNLGGAATGATVTGLPAGVTGSVSGSVFTISGAPTVNGIYNYTVTTSGSCSDATVTGKITINGPTIVRTSASGTNMQNVCLNGSITPITYLVGGTATGAVATGLPTGVSGSFSGGIFTITGAPSAGGVFNYTVTTTGSCGTVSTAGSITVNQQTITLTSGAGTNNQSPCVNTAITSITYAIGGTADDASVDGLPAGVSWNFTAGVVTISGIPSATGSFTYTVTSSGSCDVATATGTMNVQIQTIALSSAAGTDDQVACKGTAINNITYAIGGSGTGASVTGLPAGITGAYSSGVFTISGSASEAGTFGYMVTTTGSCSSVSAYGTLIIQEQTISLTSGAGSDAQVKCINTAIALIKYNLGGSASGATVTGLPAGVSGSFSGSTLTISGTPTVGGVFSYTVTGTGTCIPATATGTITVNEQTLSLGSGNANQTICQNSSMANIVFNTGGSATGASVSGLPAGVTGSYNSGVFTISGAPTAYGTFNYTVTTSGSCTAATASGTITVNRIAEGGTIANVSACYNDGGSLTLNGYFGTITDWEKSTDGITWTSTGNTAATQTFSNAQQTTWYHAIVSYGGCGTANSNNAKLGIHNLWVGGTSNDWHTATNWSDDQLPSLSCPDVIIPAVTSPAVYPVLTGAAGEANNLVIRSGASLTVLNTIIKVAGAINNNGNLYMTTGTLNLNGTAAQSIAGSYFHNHILKNLIITNNSGVSFSGVVDTLKLTGLLSFETSNAVLNTNDHLTLISNAQGTASVADLTGNGLYSNNDINGNVTVERFIPNHPKAWQYLAVPTKGQTIKDSWQEGNTALGNTKPGYGTTITGAGGVAQGFDLASSTPSMKTYDPATNGWVGVPSTNIQIANARGYMLFVRGDRSVTTFNAPATALTLRTTGRLYTTGTNAPPVTTVPSGKFESLANPYASAIDFNKLTISGGVQNDIFYVWDPLLTLVTTSGGTSAYGYGAFQTFYWNGTSFDVTPGGGSYAGSNREIESGQAFMVHAPFAPGSVTFTESAKTVGSSMVNRVANQPFSQLRTRMYALKDGAQILLDGNTAQFDSSFSNSVDIRDAEKATNTNESLGLMRNNKRLAVERHNEINNRDTLFLNMGMLKVQQYQFEFAPTLMTRPGLTAYLEDNYLNSRTEVSLTDTTRYNFSVVNVAAAYASDRFRIVFEKTTHVVLPVTILSVAANRNSDRTVNVNWKVDNETSMRHYSVERSTNGTQFEGIITAEPTVNNGGRANYTVTDRTANTGNLFYRIKAISQSGQVQYSAIVKVNGLAVESNVTVYPNPVKDRVANLQLSGMEKGNYQISLVHVNGIVQVLNSINLDGGQETRSIQLPKTLAAGVYQLKIICPDGKIVVKSIQVAD